MNEGSGCWQLSTAWCMYDRLAERFLVCVRMDILGIQDQLESKMDKGLKSTTKRWER